MALAKKKHLVSAVQDQSSLGEKEQALQRFRAVADQLAEAAGRYPQEIYDRLKLDEIKREIGVHAQ